MSMYFCTKAKFFQNGVSQFTLILSNANDIRELENMDEIPAAEGGDLYLVNGNMLPLGQAGNFYKNGGEAQ